MAAAEPYDLKFFIQQAIISIPGNLPLFLAVGQQQPYLVASAFGLTALLGKITMNGSNPVAKAFDTATEESSLKSLVSTSTFNRQIRVAMGFCHLLGAVLYTLRTSRNVDEGSEESGSSVWQWLLTLGMCLVAGVWLSTGYYGQ